MVSSKIKAKPKAKGNVRQAKITAQASQKEDTKPSAFAEVIEPKIPAFTVPVEKKPKVTAEKSGPASALSSKDLKQGKLKFPKVEVDSTSFFDDDNAEINVEQPEENLPTDDKPVALVPKKRKRVALTRESTDDCSFDSDSDMDFNVGKNVKKGPSQKKAPAKKKSPAKKPTVTKLGKSTSEKGAKKKKVHSLSDSDEGERSDEVAVRRKRGVKQDGSKKVRIIVCFETIPKICLWN